MCCCDVVVADANISSVIAMGAAGAGVMLHELLYFSYFSYFWRRNLFSIAVNEGRLRFVIYVMKMRTKRIVRGGGGGGGRIILLNAAFRYFLIKHPKLPFMWLEGGVGVGIVETIISGNKKEGA